MELTFTEYPLRSDNNIGNQGHEPDNTLVDYYLKNHRLENISCEPPLDVYANLQWQKEKRRITSKAVTRFGIKSFPGMGAYGWYHTLHENRNIVVIPINNRKVKYTPPTFTVVKANRQLTFAITQPSDEDIQYECFRITIRNGYIATEYITYDLAVTVIAPPPGTYEVTMFGYLDVDKISEDTEVYDMTISAAESNYPDGIEMIPTTTQEALAQVAKSKIFTQSIPANTWYINHGLGYKPVCNVTDENDVTVLATPRHVDMNNMEVSFAVACIGKVYMK